MDCGHFMGRTHMSTRWLLDNLGVQCLTCNRVDNGRPEKFAEYIDRTYGKGHADWIYACQTSRPLHRRGHRRDNQES